MPVHVDEKKSGNGRDVGRSWRRRVGNARPLLRGFCSDRSMFGGCRESDPNRFVRFVKGIWGVTTPYPGFQVLPGYWFSSQKRHSVKGRPAGSSGVVSHRAPTVRGLAALYSLTHSPNVGSPCRTSRCDDNHVAEFKVSHQGPTGTGSSCDARWKPQDAAVGVCAAIRRPPGLLRCLKKPQSTPLSQVSGPVVRHPRERGQLRNPFRPTRAAPDPDTRAVGRLSEHARSGELATRCGIGVWWRSRVIHVRLSLVCYRWCWGCWLGWGGLFMTGRWGSRIG